jgi:hypothetical protein
MAVCDAILALNMYVFLLKKVVSARSVGARTRMCATPVVASGLLRELGVQQGSSK